MIASANGVITTTNDDVQHTPWVDERGDWRSCETPYHQHRRPDGEWMSCQDASKFATNKKMGVRTFRNANKKEENGTQGVGTNVPINLPR